MDPLARVKGGVHREISINIPFFLFDAKPKIPIKKVLRINSLCGHQTSVFICQTDYLEKSKFRL